MTVGIKREKKKRVEPPTDLSTLRRVHPSIRLNKKSVHGGKFRYISLPLSDTLGRSAPVLNSEGRWRFTRSDLPYPLNVIWNDEMKQNHEPCEVIPQMGRSVTDSVVDAPAVTVSYHQGADGVVALKSENPKVS